jgi:hypothetical protein
MLRVFTIRFPYNGKTYSALVSFHPQSSDLSFAVRYLDEEISDVIPQRKVMIHLSKDLASPQPLSKLGQELVTYTSEAISEHLHL